MRRREFITLLGGAAAAWPLAARAQQDQRVRRIGILTALDEAENKIRIEPLLQELPRLGWSDGRNSGSTCARPEGMPKRYANMRRNCLRWRRTFSSLLARPHGPLAAGYPHRADCLHDRRRPAWLWLCQQSRAAGRQCYRLHAVRIQPERQMA